jgi:hypothetical protein
VDQRELAGLAAYVSRLDQLRDRAAHRPVDGAGAATRRGDALEQIDHDGIRAKRADVTGLNLDLHLLLPPST